MSKKRNNKEIEEIEIIDDDEIEVSQEKDNSDYENIPMEERIYQIEKKTKIIFILVILTTIFSFLTLVVGISNNGDTKTTTKTNNNNSSSNSANESLYSYDTSNFKEITASDIKKESSKETIVVMIGRQGCTYCASYAPTLEKVADDYNVKVRYIDFDLIVNVAARKVLDQDAYDTIANLEGEGNFKTFGAEAVKATPYTLFIKDNKIIYGIKGNATTSTVEAAFKSAGLKK